jgi:hypothetical protein
MDTEIVGFMLIDFVMSMFVEFPWFVEFQGFVSRFHRIIQSIAVILLKEKR